MPDTPSTKYQIVRPADEEFVKDGPSVIRQAIDLIDSLMATAITTTPRPAAGKYGRFHRAGDGTISFDTGAGWEEIARHPHAGKHGEGGSDPLTVTPAMLAGDVALPPVGAVIAYAGANLPANGRWAWADGQYIDRTVYSAFYAAVGHTHNGGADPGQNRVRLPDARGRVLVMVDGSAGRLTGPDQLGQSGGAENVALSTGHMPPHNHGGATGWMDRNNPHNHGASGSADGLFLTGSGGEGLIGWLGGPASFGVKQVGVPIGVGIANTDINHLHAIATEGSGVAHPNMPPYLVLNYLVRII